MEMNEILSKVDHTLLAQTATWAEIKAICDDGMKYGCASVCIPASYVKQAAEYVAGKLPICTVIGFPNGYDTTAAKCFMATDAVNNGAEEVDMVVTLHACDTATDFALAKAIGWNAKVILSVPCCQHELNRQMKNDVLSPIMNYGLLKERMAALVTDGLRAEYLKREGYDVQVLEFIDMEHTPKNILLRAVTTGRRADNEESIRACETFLRVTPTLGRLLDEKGEL